MIVLRSTGNIGRVFCCPQSVRIIKYFGVQAPTLSPKRTRAVICGLSNQDRDDEVGVFAFMRRKEKPKMTIYFIRAANDTGPIKIGFTNNLPDRFNAIQISSPIRLKVLLAIDGDKKLESILHQYFTDSRQMGEWFEATDTLLDFVNNPQVSIKTDPPHPASRWLHHALVKPT